MSQKFYTLLTEIGAAKLASAAALGVRLKITQMAVGDGGGVLPTPGAQQTTLIGEKRRAALNMLYIDPQNSSQIIAEQVIPETEGGWWIREVGLFDETGALIAVGNCPESYKPQLAEGSGRTQTVRMILITSSTDNVTLKIDPSVVLATRQYVDDKVLELKVYLDDQMAKHLAAADPHSQYAPRESPTFTGTPKAPTAAAGNSTTQIASTAFVQAAIAALVGSSPGALDTLNELASALSNDPDFATTMTNALADKQPRDTTLTELSGKSVSDLLQYLGLKDALLKGDGRLLAGTFQSTVLDKTLIGARAATGCQFMRAHQAPDAPDQENYWQIISLTEVSSPSSVVVVLAIASGNAAIPAIGYGTGAGITYWQHIPALEGANFTGNISAPIVSSGSRLYAGAAFMEPNGDVFGGCWGDSYLSNILNRKINGDNIIQAGLYTNDKTKPYFLHTDGSGIFLATDALLSEADQRIRSEMQNWTNLNFVQSIRFGAVEQGNIYRAPGFTDQVGYVITGVENGDSNDTPERIQRRLLQLKVNGQWYTIGA